MPRNANKSKAIPNKPIGGDVTALAPRGSTGQVLAWDAATQSWQPSTVAGTGDVVGPAGSNQYFLPMFDDTSGKVLADSGIETDGFGNLLLIDNATYIRDGADTTKRALFDASGISAATDRTFKFPNRDGTLLVAGGSVIARIIERMPPATSAAQEFTIAGASTPAESLAVLAFDDATVEYMDYKCEMSPQYSGGGLTIKLVWAAAAASNEVRWGAALRRMEISSDDFDTTGHTYAFNEIDATASATVGHWMDDEITFTDGADMDSVAAGETFILRIYRNASHANDDNTDDAYLISVSIRET